MLAVDQRDRGHTVDTSRVLLDHRVGHRRAAIEDCDRAAGLADKLQLEYVKLGQVIGDGRAVANLISVVVTVVQECHCRRTWRGRVDRDHVDVGDLGHVASGIGQGRREARTSDVIDDVRDHRVGIVAVISDRDRDDLSVILE